MVKQYRYCCVSLEKISMYVLRVRMKQNGGKCYLNVELSCGHVQLSPSFPGWMQSVLRPSKVGLKPLQYSVLHRSHRAPSSYSTTVVRVRVKCNTRLVIKEEGGKEKHSFLLTYVFSPCCQPAGHSAQLSSQSLRATFISKHFLRSLCCHISRPFLTHFLQLKKGEEIRLFFLAMFNRLKFST